MSILDKYPLFILTPILRRNTVNAIIPAEINNHTFLDIKG